MHPALLLILGAFLVPLLPRKARSLYVIALPAVALALIWSLPEGNSWNLSALLGFGELTFLRVDNLSRVFGIIFTLNATAAFLFAFYVKGASQHAAALAYIGAALGVVFAGDVISLYIFWEIMAVASTFIILARNTQKARLSAFRYIVVHIVGGLLLLAGIVLTVGKSGSIAFADFDYAAADPGTWLILAGVLINAAAPPFSAWLSDAYPEASVTGGVILSAYTTKTAVYVLLRGFTGWEPLIVVGCIMTVYGIIFALLENDMRRILAYSIINQVGFMVCAVGMAAGDLKELAVNGAVAHAFCHIIYKSLLWMSAGAVLYRVGKSKCTELGGLYKSMPWTLVLGAVGALAISALPLTSGFTSKTMIIAAAEHGHLFWPWLVLEIASAGVFLHAGIKFPFFVFFNKDRGLRPKEAPASMLAAMAILAFLCIFLGVYPQPLYALLPYPVDFQAYTAGHIITQMQLLTFSALVFFLFLKLLKRTPTIVLDTDWIYRKGAPLVATAFDKSLNGLNAAAQKSLVGRLVPALTHFFHTAPSRVLTTIATLYWLLTGVRGEDLANRRKKIYQQARLGAFPIGITASLSVLFLALLFLF